MIIREYIRRRDELDDRLFNTMNGVINSIETESRRKQNEDSDEKERLKHKVDLLEGEKARLEAEMKELKGMLDYHKTDAQKARSALNNSIEGKHLLKSILEIFSGLMTSKDIDEAKRYFSINLKNRLNLQGISLIDEVSIPFDDRIHNSLGFELTSNFYLDGHVSNIVRPGARYNGEIMPADVTVYRYDASIKEAKAPTETKEGTTEKILYQASDISKEDIFECGLAETNEESEEQEKAYDISKFNNEQYENKNENQSDDSEVNDEFKVESAHLGCKSDCDEAEENFQKASINEELKATSMSCALNDVQAILNGKKKTVCISYECGNKKSYINYTIGEEAIEESIISSGNETMKITVGQSLKYDVNLDVAKPEEVVINISTDEEYLYIRVLDKQNRSLLYSRDILSSSIIEGKESCKRKNVAFIDGCKTKSKKSIEKDGERLKNDFVFHAQIGDEKKDIILLKKGALLIDGKAIGTCTIKSPKGIFEPLQYWLFVEKDGKYDEKKQGTVSLGGEKATVRLTVDTQENVELVFEQNGKILEKKK